MSVAKTYNDEFLLNYSKCNLLDVPEKPPEYLAAYSTAKIIILKKADGEIITKDLIVKTYEKEYQKLVPKIHAAYWNGIKLGRRFISKLFWLLTKYEVLQPIQTYTNVLFGTELSMTGEYCVIQKRTESEKPLIIDFRYNKPLFYNYPNVSTSSKWLHGKTNYMDIGIYCFAMFRGDDWKQKDLDYELINDWLYGILKQVSSGFNYISPGSHCQTCISKKCLKGFV